mgnify:CR=1 FL=1
MFNKKVGLFLPKILDSKIYNSHKALIAAELQAGVDVEDPPDLADRVHSSFMINATAFAPQKLKYVLLLKQERSQSRPTGQLFCQTWEAVEPVVE